MSALRILPLAILLLLIVAAQRTNPPPSIDPNVIGIQAPTPSLTPLPPLSDRQEARVLHIVDGDTVTISLNGKTETIRIIGINTPESVDPRRPVECFGREASAKAAELLMGKPIVLETDPTQDSRDRYGRLLGYIWMENGTIDYGEYMIEQGYAYEYTYDAPYAYRDAYQQAQTVAQQTKKGLWADTTCAPTIAPTKRPAKKCADFPTQQAAQEYFLSQGGSPTNNVDRLDGSDHDGFVCESLP